MYARIKDAPAQLNLKHLVAVETDNSHLSQIKNQDDVYIMDGKKQGG